jgi:hypothetical protein
MRSIVSRLSGAVALSFLLSTLPTQAQTPPPDPHAGHDMGSMPGMEEPKKGPEKGMAEKKMEDMPGMHGMHEMPALLGPYAMTRESSGTAWQPESAPHQGFHFMAGPWMGMLHGAATLVYDDQGGRRGDQDLFSSNMLMAMASRDAGPGRLGLRVMLSAEPWTIGAKGYPLLLQTGETADGTHRLIDRQHPHDLLMEIAGTYSLPLSATSSVFLYAGLPGEPALGPTAFPHRLPAMENPEAPISHHWLDSTHISFGVATLGWVHDRVKLEGSVFTGREPDQHRSDIESPKMDSYSFRASWAPSHDWSLQVSTGHLHSPEQLEPNVDTQRTTASATYNRAGAEGRNWQTTFAWGRNAKSPGNTLDALLLESAASFGPAGRHTIFGRAERVKEDELFESGPLAGRIFTVEKLSAGYIYDLLQRNDVRLGLGGVGSVALLPSQLDSAYGNRPFSWMVFLRARN